MTGKIVSKKFKGSKSVSRRGAGVRTAPALAVLQRGDFKGVEGTAHTWCLSETAFQSEPFSL